MVNFNSDNVSILFNQSAVTADLSVFKLDTPNPVTIGGVVTYTITVTNNGPGHATGVTVAEALSAGLRLLSVASSQGGCSGNVVITCNLGTINASNNAKITLLLTPTVSGNPSSTTTVAANEIDPNSSDNSVSTKTTVLTTVNKPVAVAAPLTLPNALFNTNYDQVIAIHTGTPTSASVIRGVLPQGLRLELRAAGAPALSPSARTVTARKSRGVQNVQLAGGLTTVVVTGTPSEAGTRILTVLVEDELGRYLQRIKITVCPAAAANQVLTICDSNMMEAEAGVPYQDTIAGAGGNAPYIVEHVGGSLPHGLSFTFQPSLEMPTAFINGTPTAAARSSSFVVKITDAAESVITRTLTIPIVEPLNIVAKLGATKTNRRFATRLRANAGLTPVTWKAVSLPSGLTIDSLTGVISGRAQTPGNYNVTIQATDSLSKRVSAPVTLNVVP